MAEYPTIDSEAFKQFERNGFSKVAQEYEQAIAQVKSQPIKLFSLSSKTFLTFIFYTNLKKECDRWVGWIERSETQHIQGLYVLGYPSGSRSASTFLKPTYICSDHSSNWYYLPSLSSINKS